MPDDPGSETPPRGGAVRHGPAARVAVTRPRERPAAAAPAAGGPPRSQQHELLRILGVGFGLAITVGAVISGGVLRMPGVVAGHLGAERLIIAIWVFGGLWALLGANVTAELGTMLPKAGGPYVYLRRAYGDFVGFAGGINDFIVYICAVAYVSINVGEFAAVLVAPLAGKESGVAILTILALGGLNAIGLRAGDRVQKASSLITVVGFFALIAGGLLRGGGGEGPARDAVVEFPSALALFAASMLAFQIVSEAYAGWNSAVYFAEENTDPSRSLPRSLFGGILIVMAIYVLLNAALLVVMPVSQLAASKSPGTDAAALIFGERGGRLLTVVALIATASVVNALLLFAPRVPFAMSRDGLLPPQVMRVNRGGTPSIALSVLVVLSVAAVLSGTYETFLAMAAFFSLVGEAFENFALFVLRRREPDLPRPYRAVGYPVLPGILLIGALVFFVGYVVSNTQNSLICIGVLLLLYPAFLIVKRLSNVEPEVGP